MALTCKTEGCVTKPVCQLFHLVKLAVTSSAAALTPSKARAIKYDAKK